MVIAIAHTGVHAEPRAQLCTRASRAQRRSSRTRRALHRCREVEARITGRGVVLIQVAPQAPYVLLYEVAELLVQNRGCAVCIAIAVSGACKSRLEERLGSDRGKQ